MGKLLTEEEFFELPNGAILDVVTTDDHMFVVHKGYENDWCIMQASTQPPDSRVGHLINYTLLWGTRVADESLIRKIYPCIDTIFVRYRKTLNR